MIITMRDGTQITLTSVGRTPRTVVTECPVCYGRPCVSPKFCPGSR